MVLDNGDYWDPDDWQLEFADDLFQGFDESWLVVPEGNGKTTLMAGVTLYYGDYLPNAEIVVGAASRDQCEVLYRQAKFFIVNSPGLDKRFRAFDGYRRIRCVRFGGRIQVFASDDRTGDGVIPDLALLDELHRQRRLALYRTWRGKIMKKGGQIVAISTAGEPDSEFEQIRTKVRTEASQIERVGARVRAVMDGFCLHDYSVPLDGDTTDMVQVKAANPLSTITPESLAKKYASPSTTKGHWRRFVCNQPVRNVESAVDEAEWDVAGTDEVIPKGKSIWLGIDLGWKWDCTALVPLWMRDANYRLFGTPEILTPPRDGSSMHPEKIKDAFRRIYARNPIDTVVLDPAAGGEELAHWIEDTFGCRVIEYRHTNGPMALAAERFLEALREGWLFHPRDDEFTRHVLNATERLLPDGRTRFDRPSKSREPELQDRRVWDALDAASGVHSVAVTELKNAVDPAAYRIELL